ncbi:hypothetical protein HNO89_000396 [Sporosarcina luteola]|nr:hypothetical protein [Sporosarcina luteola]
MCTTNVNNELCLEEIIREFTPKIKKSLSNTSWQEREDLEQEIIIKIYNKYKLLENSPVPGFFEFLSQ